MKKCDETATYEVILFKSNDRLVAIEIQYLVEILEAVPVSPLPFVPSYVDGLVNINGKIMPQVDLAILLFGGELATPTTYSSKTLLIVEISGISISLKIDLVKESLSISGSSIVVDEAVSQTQEPMARPSGAKAKETESTRRDIHVDSYIIGNFDYLGEKVIFFDANALKGVVKSTAKPVGKQGFLGKVVHEKTQHEIFNEYLITEVVGKEFAVDLEEVNEIIIMESIKSQPRAPKLIAGVGLVRGEPRLMVSLAALLGEGVAEKTTAGAAIMVRFNDIQCGILAEKMVGLETIRQSQLKQNREKNYLTILREDGHTLTRVICFSSLFDDKVLGQIKPYLPNLKNTATQVAVKQVEMLRFQLNGDAYALRLNEIRRVVSGKVIEPVLREQGYIMGTMELEGKVLPVINLVNQLGYEQSGIPIFEYIVVSEGGRDWGLAINETDQIIKIDEPKIDNVKNQDARYVAAYSSYEDDLLTILNLKAICHDNYQVGAV